MTFSIGYLAKRKPIANNPREKTNNKRGEDKEIGKGVRRKRRQEERKKESKKEQAHANAQSD